MLELAGIEKQRLDESIAIEPIKKSKIKSLSDKLYKEIKPADKLFSGVYNKNNPEGLKIMRRLEKMANKEMVNKYVYVDGRMWKITSVEYSINGGDWWVYAKTISGEYDTENWTIGTLY